MARSSHAACHSFFTVRRVGMVAARRSTALRLTRIVRTMSRSSDMPGFRSTWSFGRVRGGLTRVRFGFAVIREAAGAARKRASASSPILPMYASTRGLTRANATPYTSTLPLYWFPIRVDHDDGRKVRRPQGGFERRTVTSDDDDQMLGIDEPRCRGSGAAFGDAPQTRRILIV